MRRISLLVILAAVLVASSASAQGGLTIFTHPDHAGLICFAEYDGVLYGDCGGGGLGASGLAFANMAAWFDRACDYTFSGAARSLASASPSQANRHSVSSYSASSTMPSYGGRCAGQQQGGYDLTITGNVLHFRYWFTADHVSGDVGLEFTSYQAGSFDHLWRVIDGSFEEWLWQDFDETYNREMSHRGQGGEPNGPVMLANTRGPDARYVLLWVPSAVSHHAFNNHHGGEHHSVQLTSRTECGAMAAGQTCHGEAYVIVGSLEEIWAALRGLGA